MLSSEQIKQVKEQLLKQIESWPKEQQEQAKKELETMSSEQFEEFLIRNKLIKVKEETLDNKVQTSEKQQCVFCSIVKGEIQAYRIDENKHSIAVLEINPISKGHAIVIPKKHANAEKIPADAFSLAKKISQKLKTKLKTKQIDISTSTLFGHALINVLPIYENENMNSKRKQVSKEELENLQNMLKKEEKPKQLKEKVMRKSEKLPEAPKRFP